MGMCAKSMGKCAKSMVRNGTGQCAKYMKKCAKKYEKVLENSKKQFISTYFNGKNAQFV